MRSQQSERVAQETWKPEVKVGEGRLRTVKARHAGPAHRKIQGSCQILKAEGPGILAQDMWEQGVPSLKTPSSACLPLPVVTVGS